MLTHDKVQQLRDDTGCGMIQCVEALALFEGNMKQAHLFLELKGLAVARYNKEGKSYTIDDYIEHVKREIPDEEEK